MSLALFSTKVAAQSAKVQGLIKGRNGDTIILQTWNAPNLVVLLTDSSDVGQVPGVLKARKKEMSTAALIAGLPVKVEGTYNAENELVAKSSRLRAMICSGRKPSRLEHNRQMSHRIQEKNIPVEWGTNVATI